MDFFDEDTLYYDEPLSYFLSIRQHVPFYGHKSTLGQLLVKKNVHCILFSISILVGNKVIVERVSISTPQKSLARL